MKLIIMLALISPMFVGTPQQITKPLSNPIQATRLSQTRAEKKATLCAVAKMTAREINDLIKVDHSNSKAYVVGCEVGDTTAYFIVSMEQVENDILIRKVDVIYLAMFLNKEWVVMYQEPLMKEGTAYGDDPSLDPTPNLEEINPSTKQEIMKL